MFWITKYRHNKHIELYEKRIEDLREALNRKEDITEILDRLTNKEQSPYLLVDDGYITSASVMDSLDDSIPRYVEDYFGGRVIEQESSPVTILDKKGKATYGQTAKKLPKGHGYHLVQQH